MFQALVLRSVKVVNWDSLMFSLGLHTQGNILVCMLLFKKKKIEICCFCSEAFLAAALMKYILCIFPCLVTLFFLPSHSFGFLVFGHLL